MNRGIKKSLAVASSALALFLANPVGKSVEAGNSEPDHASRTATFIGDYGRPERIGVDFYLSHNENNLTFSRSLSEMDKAKKKARIDPTNEALCISHPKEISINYETITQDAIIMPDEKYESLTPFEYDADSQFWIGHARDLMNDLRSKSPQIVKSVMKLFTGYLGNKNKEKMYNMRRKTNLENVVECMPMFVPERIAINIGYEIFRQVTIPLIIPNNLAESKKVYVISSVIVREVSGNQVFQLDEAILSRDFGSVSPSQRTYFSKTEVASPSQENGEIIFETRYGDSTPKIFKDFAACNIKRNFEDGLKNEERFRTQLVCPEYLVPMNEIYSIMEKIGLKNKFNTASWNTWSGISLVSNERNNIHKELVKTRLLSLSERIAYGKKVANNAYQNVSLREVKSDPRINVSQLQKAFNNNLKIYLSENPGIGSKYEQKFFFLVSTSQGERILPMSLSVPKL